VSFPVFGAVLCRDMPRDMPLFVASMDFEIVETDSHPPPSRLVVARKPGTVLGPEPGNRDTGVE